MATYSENPIIILDSSNSSNSSSGALVVDGGVAIKKNIFVSGTTASFHDNILLLNSNPISSNDTGIIWERFSTDISSSNRKFSGLLFNETLDEFSTSYLQTEPSSGTASIHSYTNLKSSELTLVSTRNSIGINSGGALNVLGGANFSKNLFVGDTLNVLNAVITNLTVANNFVNDFLYTESLFKDTTTSTSFQSKINYTASNLNSGSYLIQFSYDISSSTEYLNFNTQFLLDNIIEHDYINTVVNKSDIFTVSSFIFKTLNTGNHTIDLFYKKNSSKGSVGISNAKVFLYKLAPSSTYFFENSPILYTTNTFFQDVLTDTFSIPGGTYVIFVSSLITSSSEFSNYSINLLINNVLEHSYTNSIINKNDIDVFSITLIKFYTAQSISFNLQFKKNSSKGSVGISNSKILFFRLE